MFIYRFQVLKLVSVIGARDDNSIIQMVGLVQLSRTCTILAILTFLKSETADYSAHNKQFKLKKKINLKNKENKSPVCT